MIPKELHGSLGETTYRTTDAPDSQTVPDQMTIGGKLYRRLRSDEVIIDGDCWSNRPNPDSVPQMTGHTGKQASHIEAFGKDYHCYRPIDNEPAKVAQSTHCTQSNRICQHDEEDCDARSGEPDNWYCTLPKGHDGPHIACCAGADENHQHNLEVWED